MEVVGLLFIGLGIFFARKEFKAGRKRKEIIKGIEFVHTDLKTKEFNSEKKKEAIIDGMILGTGATIATVFDIYKSIEEHEDILESVGNNFDNIIGDNSPLEWGDNLMGLEEGDIVGEIGNFSEHSLMALTENGGANFIENSEDIMDIEDIDVSDNIPYIAIALFGLKTLNNIKSFSDGNQSRYELGVNVGVDAVRVGTGGFFAFGGAEIGSVLGTCILPGVGTIIGGGIGAIVGGIAGCGIFSYVKERLKWGKIIDCIEHIGMKYNTGFSTGMKKKLKEKYLNIDEISDLLDKEKKIKEKYSDALDPYSKEKVSIQAILSHEYTKSLELSIKKIDKAIDGFFPEIKKLCKACGAKRGGSVKKENRFLGELLVTSNFLLEGENLNSEDKKHISNYYIQISKVQSHPYEFAEPTEDILQGLLYKKFSDLPSIDLDIRIRNLALIYYGLAATCIWLGVKFII